MSVVECHAVSTPLTVSAGGEPALGVAKATGREMDGESLFGEQRACRREEKQRTSEYPLIKNHSKGGQRDSRGRALALHARIQDGWWFDSWHRIWAPSLPGPISEYRVRINPRGPPVWPSNQSINQV